MSRNPNFCIALVVFLTVGTTEAPPQGEHATVYGVVRGVDRQPLSGVLVRGGARQIVTDSAGRFTIDSLPAGSARITLRRLGMGSVDTTLTLQAGMRTQWDATMREHPLFAEARRSEVAAESARVNAGAVDSVGSGLIKPSAVPALPDGGFGRRLFADAVERRGADSNTVLSPVSVVLALSIVRHGARGGTANALDQLLGVDKNDDVIGLRGPEVVAALNGRTDVVVEVANAIWVDTSFALTPPFAAAAARWRAAVTSLPLASPDAVQPINHWADSVTHGKIKGILDKPLPDTARLFIANAVYFNGKWLDPFQKSATKPGPFTLPSGQLVTVQRMERVASLFYRRLTHAQMVRIPYRAGKVAMQIILPDSGVSFEDAVRDIRDTSWALPMSSADRRSVRLVLPRFHAELGVDLLPALEAMGAGIALDCGRADFTGMGRPRAPDRPGQLCIDKALQRVYIDVNEEGTEAAAVTGMAMIGVSGLPAPPIEFVVDRPFFFVLRDEVTGTDLFVGRIARP